MTLDANCVETLKLVENIAFRFEALDFNYVACNSGPPVAVTHVELNSAGPHARAVMCRARPSTATWS